jgi:hypothetical protein
MLNIKREIEECKKEGMPDFLIEEHILDLIAENDIPECYEEYTFNDDMDSACLNQTNKCNPECPMWRRGFDS